MVSMVSSQDFRVRVPSETILAMTQLLLNDYRRYGRQLILDGIGLPGMSLGLPSFGLIEFTIPR